MPESQNFGSGEGKRETDQSLSEFYNQEMTDCQALF